MSIPVSITVWIQEDSDLPTGYLNPHGHDGVPFPMIHLDGAVLQGLNGDPVPYLRRLAEVATRLADELASAKAVADAAAVTS